MSKDVALKKELLKEVLKSIHRGESPETLKQKFASLLSQVEPHEIPLLEQELVREGVPVGEILKLCDLHVALFRDYIASREIRGVPKGHPLDLLMRENEEIAKLSEALQLYASLLSGEDFDKAKAAIRELQKLANELHKVRIHYRKIQMLLFPYLERRGITAVPRVLWGREDEALLKIRELQSLLERPEESSEYYERLSRALREVSNELLELVFRENKILYPTLWVLLSEGEWAAVSSEMPKIGFIVKVEEEWKPSTKVKPLLPHQVSVTLDKSQVEKLPREMKAVLLSRTIVPDRYEIEGNGRLALKTGYLTLSELQSILSSLPVEVTFADKNGRVVFYSESKLFRGFVRTQTILGRRLEYCHPPRLEGFVRELFEKLKRGELDHAVFWTRVNGRIVRVMVVAVRGDNGEFHGAVEIVEDMTDIVKRAGEIEKEIVVL